MKIDAEIDVSAVEIQGETVIASDRTLAAVGLSTDTSGNAVAGAGSLAPAATAGFLFVPDVAGAPTGIPDTKTGFSPLCYDPTEHKLWVYDTTALAWRGAVLE